MKGQAKRFVDHTGRAFKMRARRKEANDNIGFFDLWRYATPLEVSCTLASILTAFACSCSLLAAIVAYGEITSLFVQRHRAAETTPHVYILGQFGGGKILPAGNRSLHMDALVQDSISFGVASIAIMAAQLITGAVAVTMANWTANRMVSRLRWRLLRAVITQEIAFFDTNTNMNFASALTEDMDKLKSGVGEHVAMTSFLGGTVVLGAALSLSYGWELTLAGLAVVPVSIIVAGVVAKHQTKWSGEEVRAYGAAGRVVEEALAAVRTVRAYAGELVELDRYWRLLGGARAAARCRGAWAGAGAGAGWLLTYALNAVVFAYGALLCVADMDLPAADQRYHPGIMLTVRLHSHLHSAYCSFIRWRGAWAGAGAGAGWLLTYALNAVVFAYGALLCVADMDLPAADQRYHPGIMLTVRLHSHLHSAYCSFIRWRGAWAGAGAGAGWLLTYALNAVVFAYGALLCVADMDLPAADQRYHPGIMLTVRLHSHLHSAYCSFIRWRGAWAGAGAGAGWLLTYALNAVVFAYGALLCVADMDLPAADQRYHPGIMLTVRLHSHLHSAYCSFIRWRGAWAGAGAGAGWLLTYALNAVVFAYGALLCVADMDLPAADQRYHPGIMLTVRLHSHLHSAYCSFIRWRGAWAGAGAGAGWLLTYALNAVVFAYGALLCVADMDLPAADQRYHPGIMLTVRLHSHLHSAYCSFIRWRGAWAGAGAGAGWLLTYALNAVVFAYGALLCVADMDLPAADQRYHPGIMLTVRLHSHLHSAYCSFIRWRGAWAGAGAGAGWLLTYALNAVVFAYGALLCVADMDLPAADQRYHPGIMLTVRLHSHLHSAYCSFIRWRGAWAGAGAGAGWLLTYALNAVVFAYGALLCVADMDLPAADQRYHPGIMLTVRLHSHLHSAYCSFIRWRGAWAGAGAGAGWLLTYALNAVVFAYGALLCVADMDLPAADQRYHPGIMLTVRLHSHLHSAYCSFIRWRGAWAGAGAGAGWLLTYALNAVVFAYGALLCVADMDLPAADQRYHPGIMLTVRLHSHLHSAYCSFIRWRGAWAGAGAGAGWLLTYALNAVVFAYGALLCVADMDLPAADQRYHPGIMLTVRLHSHLHSAYCSFIRWRGAWAGAGAGAGWLLTYALNAVVFAYGALLCVADMDLPAADQRYHPGIMLTVRLHSHLHSAYCSFIRWRGAWAGAGAGAGWLLTYALNAVVFAYGALLCVADMDLPAADQRYHPGIMLTVRLHSHLHSAYCSFIRWRGAWAGAGAGAGWLLTYALNAVVFAYGALLCVADMDLPAADQRYHPGIMLTILFCTFIAAQNIAMCQPHLETFSTARGAAKSLFKLLERKSKINPLEQTGIKPEKFRGDIVFENLYFNYPSRPDVKVLRGLTLKVNAGETVALVGSSGCGKSTLLQLLQRLYTPDSGRVIVDGYPLNDLQLHHYRTSIGVVGQEPVLFSGTIRENISFGMDATDEQIIAAAKTANAHSFIVKLSKGYDTLLGGNGASLSGGQKQRVAIARALLRNPSILLLDEPTSALDPVSERQVQAALDAASAGRTTLVVSHRLATIVNATKIVYMHQGAALEEGSHTELLQKQGLYHKLVQEDMTNQSAMAALSDEDKLDEVEDIKTEIFRRTSVQRRSTQSLQRDSMLRGSRRMGSIAAPIPEITIQPDECTETAEDEPSASSWQLLKLNAPEWRLLVGGALASLLVGATMPTFALLLSELYGMFSWSDRELILSESRRYALYFLLAAASCGAVTFLQTWLFALAGARLTDRLRKMCFGNYLKQEQAWFDQPSNSVGALCARLASDCAAVQGATGTRLGTVLQGVSTMSIGVTLAMFYSWKMTLVSLLSVPCVMGGICLESYITRKAEAAETRSLEQASKVATEAVLNVRTVQTLGVEQTILDRYTASLRSTGLSITACIRGPVYGLCLCAPTLGYAVSLAYGGYLIAREDLPYKSAILVAEALIYGAWMLAEALSFAPNFAAARRAGARILHGLHRQPAIRTEGTADEIKGWSSRGELEFNSITFHYPSRPNARVLSGASVRVRAGRTLALVGASGCGKSTLVQLLQRAYEPSGGTITLDGYDIKRDLTLPQLRAQFGLVQQEPSLFSRSIKDNIAYGDNSRDVPLEEIIEAAKQANVHSFIAGLPLGYDTLLGGGGASLSGGQKQRVAIARALLRNPSVLLLDEATSALDANSEKAVQAALEAASANRSTIIIAHRLATVRHAHDIAVIDKGVVAEIGSHEELVRKRGLYFELLKQQAPADAS